MLTTNDYPMTSRSKIKKLKISIVYNNKLCNYVIIGRNEIDINKKQIIFGLNKIASIFRINDYNKANSVEHNNFPIKNTFKINLNRDYDQESHSSLDRLLTAVLKKNYSYFDCLEIKQRNMWEQLIFNITSFQDFQWLELPFFHQFKVISIDKTSIQIGPYVTLKQKMAELEAKGTVEALKALDFMKNLPPEK